MSEFNREDRYIVIKRSDLTQDDMAVLSDVIHDRTIKTRDCVVVESHWPNYEQTWQTIQQVAEGTYKPAAPDVSVLVEALERIVAWPNGGNQYGQANIKIFASEALVTHRKQGVEP